MGEDIRWLKEDQDWTVVGIAKAPNGSITELPTIHEAPSKWTRLGTSEQQALSVFSFTFSKGTGAWRG
jgi:hypothetical protein